jgi:5-oxoprolinase (ATP-hydrolysing) subunit C
VAVPGGFEATSVLGSASYYGRARLGEAITRGKVLRQRSEGVAVFPDGVAGRFMPSDVCRNYAQPPRLRIWRGPEWEAVDPRLVENVTRGEWRVSARSDRVGYRLEGVREGLPVPSIVSGPAQVGTLQCPEDGTLIVTMRDGPTVGGYARLGLLFPEDLSWLTQCRPGQSAQFEWMNYGSEL